MLTRLLLRGYFQSLYVLCYNRDREGDRRDNRGPTRSNRERELDEDESYERRKRERRQKERSQAYLEVGNFEYT